jgi:hypothetical protein
MEIGKAFSYVFEDENWVKKVLMGGLFTLLSLLLVGIPFVLGYMVQTIRNVIEGQPRPLPEWDNLGEKFMSGLMLLIIMIIYSIPSFLFSCIGNAGSIMASSGGGGGDQETMTTIITALSACGGCLNILWSIVLAVITPVIYLKYTLTRELGSAFSFGEFLPFIQADIGSYILTVIMTFVASIVCMIVGGIACVIGLIFTMFYAQLITAALYGQLYRAVTAKGGPALA